MAMLHDLEVDPYLKSCVTIERDELDQEFGRLPADLAYWNERYARSLGEFFEADLAADHLKAQLFIEYRLKLQTEAGATDPKKGGPTLDQIKSETTNDERWEAARRRLIRAEVEKTRLRGVVDAVVAKKDMLQSLGAKLRAEMTDPLVRHEVSSRRVQRGDE